MMYQFDDDPVEDHDSAEFFQVDQTIPVPESGDHQDDWERIDRMYLSVKSFLYNVPALG